MKPIILSADNAPSVYLVYDAVADNLQKYINKFYNWLENKRIQEKRKINVFDEKDFIRYIDSLFPQYPCKLVKKYEEDEYWEDGWDLPEKYKDCEWYNF